MKKSRFTDEQKIAILQQAAAGAQVRELCRKHGITEQTFYRWRGKLQGIQVSDAKRLRALEGLGAVCLNGSAAALRFLLVRMSTVC